MVRHIVSIVDDRWFAILRTRGSVKVEAIKPDTSSIQSLSCLSLVARFFFDRNVKVQISGGSGKHRFNSRNLESGLLT